MEAFYLDGLEDDGSTKNWFVRWTKIFSADKRSYIFMNIYLKTALLIFVTVLISPCLLGNESELSNDTIKKEC